MRLRDIDYLIIILVIIVILSYVLTFDFLIVGETLAPSMVIGVIVVGVRRWILQRTKYK